MSVYEGLWNSYWSDLAAEPHAAIWDVDPELAAALHLPLFQAHVDPTLPMIDLGCGNGTQTAYLGRHFDRTIGVDISDTAIRRAQALNSSPSTEYRQLDVLDLEAVNRLHQETGDVNVYVRTVIHQLGPAEWPTFVEAVATLTGRAGAAFLVELGPAAHQYFTDTIATHGLPDKLGQALEHGLRPAELPEGELVNLLQAHGFHIVARGPLDYHTTQELPDGDRMVIPAEYVVASLDATR